MFLETEKKRINNPSIKQIFKAIETMNGSFAFLENENGDYIQAGGGINDEYTVECLKGLDAVLLEANHDVKMLQTGPYPYPLKQRILSERGHLSNEASGQLLSRILHDDMKYVFLGHLSKENNIPELAYEAVRMEVTLSPVNNYRGDDFCINVAKRSEPSELIAI